MGVRKDYGQVIQTGKHIHAAANTQASAGSEWGPATDYGIGLKRVAHVLYDFAVDGGAQGEIVPATNVLLPANAIIVGGVMNVITAPAGTGATVSVGTHAGSGAATILAATAITAMTTDVVTELLGNNSQAATQKAPFKMSAAGKVSITIATHDLTAGKIEWFLDYYVAANA